MMLANVGEPNAATLAMPPTAVSAWAAGVPLFTAGVPMAACEAMLEVPTISASVIVT